MIPLHDLASPSSSNDPLSPVGSNPRLHSPYPNSGCLGNAPSVSMANAAFAAQLDPSYPIGAVSPPPQPPLPHSATDSAGSHYVLSGTPGGHRHSLHHSQQQQHHQRQLHNGTKNVDDDDFSDEDDDDRDDGLIMMPMSAGDNSCYVRFA